MPFLLRNLIIHKMCWRPLGCGGQVGRNISMTGMVKKKRNEIENTKSSHEQILYNEGGLGNLPQPSVKKMTRNKDLSVHSFHFPAKKRRAEIEYYPFATEIFGDSLETWRNATTWEGAGSLAASCNHILYSRNQNFNMYQYNSPKSGKSGWLFKLSSLEKQVYEEGNKIKKYTRQPYAQLLNMRWKQGRKHKKPDKCWKQMR